MSPAKNRWAAWSVVVAVLSLAAALVFNGIQVRNNVVAERQTKLATELSILTQLHTLMNDSVYNPIPFSRRDRLLRVAQERGLTPAIWRVAAREMANMEYFAWLFNNDYVGAGHADELWGPAMNCEYQAFKAVLPAPAQDMPELTQFIHDRGPRLSRLDTNC